MATPKYPIPLVAWTGGDRAPKGFRKPMFLAMCKALMVEQLDTFRSAWRKLPDSDTLHIFVMRARHDAWRSFTEWEKNSNGLHV